VVVVALIVFGAVKNPFHHSGGPSPDTVASTAGMDYCDNSGYYLQSRLDGSKQTIYDCMKGPNAHCITMSGGIASDSTVEVRLVFQGTLGASKPSCLEG
jgi:hypothetical protein